VGRIGMVVPRALGFNSSLPYRMPLAQVRNSRNARLRSDNKNSGVCMCIKISMNGKLRE
jgi:hypothetical protein